MIGIERKTKHHSSLFRSNSSLRKGLVTWISTKTKNNQSPSILTQNYQSFISNRSFKVRVERDISELNHVKAGTGFGTYPI